jgi:transcription elongation factor Elf1
MATSTIFFACNHCTEGRVKKTIKATKKELSITIGNCNKCGRSFGIKSSAGLTELPSDQVANSLSDNSTLTPLSNE